MTDKVTMILIDLTELPERGPMTVLARGITQDDKMMMDLAAQALGLSQTDFLRTVLVSTARKVLQENAR